VTEFGDGEMPMGYLSQCRFKLNLSNDES